MSLKGNCIETEDLVPELPMLKYSSISSEFPWKKYNHEYKLCFDVNFNHMSQSQV